jgi:hypothetical protein
MNKYAIAAGLGSNSAGNDITLFENNKQDITPMNSPEDEDPKKLIKKDVFMRRYLKKTAKADGLGGTSAEDGSYSGFVDGYRDNKSYVEDGYSPESPKGFVNNFQRKQDVHRKLRKKS